MQISSVNNTSFGRVNRYIYEAGFEPKLFPAQAQIVETTFRTPALAELGETYDFDVHFANHRRSDGSYSTYVSLEPVDTYSLDSRRRQHEILPNLPAVVDVAGVYCSRRSSSDRMDDVLTELKGCTFSDLQKKLDRIKNSEDVVWRRNRRPQTLFDEIENSGISQVSFS